MQGYDQYTKLEEVRQKRKLITAREQISYEEAYNMMDEANISSLPIVNIEGKLVGIMTKKNAVR